MSDLKSNGMVFLSGLVFAAGLGISGMTMPSKVIGFLDLTGAWDPSLAFVMIGAIAVHLVAGLFVRRRSAPLFDKKFHLPTSTMIDRRLLAGAALFGMGWGLGGFCPGPGLVSLFTGKVAPLLFVFSMTAGMILHYFVFLPRTSAVSKQR